MCCPPPKRRPRNNPQRIDLIYPSLLISGREGIIFK